MLYVLLFAICIHEFYGWGFSLVGLVTNRPPLYMTTGSEALIESHLFRKTLYCPHHIIIKPCELTRTNKVHIMLGGTTFNSEILKT